MEKSNNKRLTINVVANCIAFAVNFIISFFLTPYIVEHVGKDVYGFVALGNDFVNYASLISLAINSMASRFITIKLQQKDYESANKYFASVLLSNIVICLILLIPAICVVLFLEKLVDVPQAHIVDIKVLWALLYINFFISLIGGVYQIATFAKNRVDLSARLNIKAYIIKSVILFVSYYFLNPYILYVGIATIISTIYNTVVSIRYTRQLTPEIKFDKNKFDKKSIKELLFSGIWNTVSRIGGIALSELDLLLSNVLISASAMGTLSLVKIIPNYIASLISTITTAIMPQLVISYADESDGKKELVKNVKNEIRILIFINAIVYSIIITFSDKFYMLWLNITNSEELKLMYYVGIISILDCLVSSVMYVVFNVFTVFNKLKLSAISVIITGVISLGVTYLTVKFTNLGLYAIAGVSITLVILRNLFVLIPYATKLLKLRWYELYKYIILNIFAIAVSVVIGFLYKSIFKIDGWISLILVCAISVITIAIVNVFIVLRKEERNMFKRKLLNKEI